MPNTNGGWVDTEAGRMYRRGVGVGRNQEAPATDTDTAPATGAPAAMGTHGRTHVVEFRGQRVGHVKSAWKRALDRASIAHCTKHDLRHTAITWAMHNGMDRWDAAGYFGVTMDTLERVYAHHHPDYLQGAVEAMERKPNLYGRTDSRGLKAI